MTGAEMTGVSAFVILVLKTIMDFFLKLMEKLSPPKLTQADVEDMKWKTNLLGIQDEMRKTLERLNDKGDERAKTLDDIHSYAERDHRNLGEVKNHVQTLSNLYANTDFCKKGDK